MGSLQQVLRVGILSSPGLGHVIPVLALGNRLATLHNISVTVFVITSGSSPAETKILKSAKKSEMFDVVEIQAADISNLIDSNTKMVTRLCVLVRETLHVVKSTISPMKHILDALIVDLLCTEALPVAKEFGLPNYVYIPSNAWITASSVYCPVLDKEIEGQYVDQDEPLKIPGCKSILPEDVVDPMLDRNDQEYREYLRMGVGFCLSDGILMNTWEDAETDSLKAFRENEILKAIVNSPVYPIGPLTRNNQQIIDESTNDDKSNFVLNWLDQQSPDSVLYVSFGSGGTLSSKQITELAFGLELSQQKFVWVVRPPSEEGTNKSFFTTGKGGDGTPDYLPEGFLARTKDFGLVIQLWTDQGGILSHPSIGGFLSHCGWNSSIESITNGVPMIAWPLYAEQRQNATMLTEELGVAVRPEVLPTKKVVEREEIEQLVRMVMQYKEGNELKENVKRLKMSAEKALSVGGTSHDSMCEFLKDIEKKIHG